MRARLTRTHSRIAVPTSTGVLGPLLPTPTSSDIVPDPEMDAVRPTPVSTPVAPPPRRVHPGVMRPTPHLLARLGIPTPSSAQLGIPTGDSPVARALRLTRDRTPLDRILAGDRPPEPQRGALGRALRVLVDPGLWLPGTYAEVATRLRERYPQVWLALAGSRPPVGRLSIMQRVAARHFVEGTGKARIAVLAGDADLQALVRTARLQRRLMYLLVLGLLGAAVASIFMRGM